MILTHSTASECPDIDAVHLDTGRTLNTACACRIPTGAYVQKGKIHGCFGKDIKLIKLAKSITEAFQRLGEGKIPPLSSLAPAPFPSMSGGLCATTQGLKLLHPFAHLRLVHNFQDTLYTHARLVEVHPQRAGQLLQDEEAAMSRRQKSDQILGNLGDQVREHNMFFSEHRVRTCSSM